MCIRDRFCFKWIDSLQDVQRIETREQRRQFLLNMVCFAGCIEGLFFFGAFAYVYYPVSYTHLDVYKRQRTNKPKCRARRRSRSRRAGCTAA